MWCKTCNIETNEKICPICGCETVEDLPVEIYWCKDCAIPVIHTSNAADKGTCPVCAGKTHYLTSDLRPVFPEERLLLAVLLDKEPDRFMNRSIWAVGSRYYVDGKSMSISAKTFEMANADEIANKISKCAELINYTAFNENIRLFIRANEHRLAYLKDEAFSFVHHAAERFKEENIVISFSGGKDSTVTADVVTKALSNPSLVHIFGNTTLEFPATIEYADRFRDNHPLAIFMTAKNDEQVFYDVCKDKGMRCVEKKPDVFIAHDENPMDVLGIGANMVKALRYWLQAVGLTEEPNRGKRTQSFTDLGQLIYEHDTYIEELGTLYLLQYRLATQKEEATAWYFFFNEFSISEFSREDFVEALQKYIKMQDTETDYAIRSLNDDFQCIVNTYLPRYKSNPDKVSPENNIDCPFGELGKPKNLLRIIL